MQSITGLAQERFQLTGEFTRASGNKVLVTTRIEQTEFEKLKSNFFRLTAAHQWIWSSFQMRLGVGAQYYVLSGRDLDDDGVAAQNVLIKLTIRKTGQGLVFDFTGSDPQVREFVLGQPEAAEYLAELGRLFRLTLPAYQREGKSYLTIAIGCTGGRHRSVAIAEELAGWLRDAGRSVTLSHRDVGAAGEAGGAG